MTRLLNLTLSFIALTALMIGMLLLTAMPALAACDAGWTKIPNTNACQMAHRVAYQVRVGDGIAGEPEPNAHIEQRMRDGKLFDGTAINNPPDAIFGGVRTK